MKKLNFIFAAVLSCSCASSPNVHSNDKSNPDTKEIFERSGLQLEQSETYFKSLKITRISQDEKFTQMLDLLPGEDMSKAAQPAELRAYKPSMNHSDDAGDNIIGVNGRFNWKSLEELQSAVESAYAGNSIGILQVLTQNWEIKNLMVGYDHKRSDLDLLPAEIPIPISLVTKVTPGSWAEKSGLEKQDFIFGKAKFETAEKRRSRIPVVNLLVAYSVDEKLNSGNVGRTEAAYNFLNQMFRDMKPYRPAIGHRKGVMGYNSLLRVAVIRNGILLRKNLYYSKYVGVGPQFGCLPYCGAASPLIKALPEESPGFRDGLKLEDHVISVNGKKVYNSWDTVQYIRKFNYGDELTFVVIRNGQPVKVKTRLDWVVEYK